MSASVRLSAPSEKVLISSEVRSCLVLIVPRSLARVFAWLRRMFIAVLTSSIDVRMSSSSCQTEVVVLVVVVEVPGVVVVSVVGKCCDKVSLRIHTKATKVEGYRIVANIHSGIVPSGNVG